MTTMTRMVSLVAVLLSLFGSSTLQAQLALWDWETGDLQGWQWHPDTPGNPVLSLGAGRNSDYSLSVSGPMFSTMHVANPGIESDDLLGVGNYGEYVPFASGAGIFFDADFLIPSQHAVYLDLVIYGSATESRWLCYPLEGPGSIVSLGDGWYRYNFENREAYEYSSEYPAPPIEMLNSIVLTWGYVEPSDYRIDNFTIQSVPEPSTAVLLALGMLGCFLFGLRYRKQSIHR